MAVVPTLLKGGGCTQTVMAASMAHVQTRCHCLKAVEALRSQAPGLYNIPPCTSLTFGSASTDSLRVLALQDSNDLLPASVHVKIDAAHGQSAGR